MIFRYDIQELRGIAVLLVILYHLNSNILPGGFIGVDIFFVISGYIIIISLSTIKTNNKRLILFYSKRIKRLFPSSTTCLLLCYYYHPIIDRYSVDETELFYDIISCLCCLSNIRFYIITNSYFQSDKKSIILNYWSLSLEEQYYIIYPLLYFYISNNIHFYEIIALCSYYKCIVNTYKNDSSSYYLLSNRVWELIVGCIIHNYRICILINSQIIVCLIIISSYFIGIFTALKFPGFISLLPITLTSLIIKQSNYQLYNSKLISIIGNMSYVLYLFHYPVIQNSTSLFLIVIQLLCISSIVYNFIEIPLRNITCFPLLISISLIMVIIFIINLIKSINRNKKKIVNLFNINNMYCSYKNKYHNIINKYNKKTVLLIGDSHLYQFLSIIETSFSKYDIDNVVGLSKI